VAGGKPSATTAFRNENDLRQELLKRELLSRNIADSWTAPKNGTLPLDKPAPVTIAVK
jgi:hypothetical protein